MNFDELQDTWQKQNASGQVEIKEDALLSLIRRNHHTLEGTLSRRDTIEIIVALLLIPVWIWLGFTKALPWTWYLVIPGLIWIAGFLFRDRMQQRNRKPHPGNSLCESVDLSLAQVSHQIHLLKTILRWYLLPVALPLFVFVIHFHWLDRSFWGGAHHLIVNGLIFWGLYELNQWTVRKELEPRLKELREFSDSLEQTNPTEETTTS